MSNWKQIFSSSSKIANSCKVPTTLKNESISSLILPEFDPKEVDELLAEATMPWDEFVRKLEEKDRSRKQALINSPVYFARPSKTKEPKRTTTVPYVLIKKSERSKLWYPTEELKKKVAMIYAFGQKMTAYYERKMFAESYEPYKQSNIMGKVPVKKNHETFFEDKRIKNQKKRVYRKI